MKAFSTASNEQWKRDHIRRARAEKGNFPYRKQKTRKRTCANMRRGGKKLTSFFYFHTSRQPASNISLLLYSLFFFTSFVLAMSFFTTTIIMNIDRYGRLGISDGDCISSLCVFLLGVFDCLF